MTENFLELIEIDDIEFTKEYKNMVDISVLDDESFILSNGIISHNSAGGSLKQARDPEREGVYSLKGKVKNAKKLSDLSNNKELLELMSILGIDPDSNKQPSYKNIVIAADQDSDGGHITSLIINFFYKWFPYIIENKHLSILVTPLVSCDSRKKRKYFYSLEEFTNFAIDNPTTNINYLKGLGSLSIDDWNFVMKNKLFFTVINDRSANKYLDIAFGDSSIKRKKWLSS
jgi:DNA gyrase subunit B